MTAEQESGVGGGAAGTGAHRPKYTAVTVVKAIVLSCVVVWILSFIYGPIDHHSPLVYLNLLIGFGMGMVVSMVVQWSLRRHRIDGRGGGAPRRAGDGRVCRVGVLARVFVGVE